jgi:hypothetical protein
MTQPVASTASVPPCASAACLAVARPSPRRIGTSPKAAAFYALVMEATIGMALGRAVSPANRPVAHEPLVIALLSELAAKL